MLYPIPTLDICIPSREEMEAVSYLLVDFYLCQSISKTNLPIFNFFYVIHSSVLIIFKLCIYAESISLNHKNYNFHDCDCFQKLTFSIDLLAMLLSDSLLWDSSISRLHPKLWFKSTNHILGFNHHRDTTWLITFSRKL